MLSESLHIVLLRHGETDANRMGIVQGHRQTPLNELGRRQARLLAERMKGFEPKIEHLVCSDLLRAMQTAEPIARALGLVVAEYLPAWRERCYGQFEGMNPHQRMEMRQRLQLMDADPPPGAQGTMEYQGQIRRALLDLVEKYAGANCVAVVTHGGACRAVLMMLADGRLPLLGPPIKASDQVTANCSVTHLVYHRAEAAFAVSCRNDVAHLQALATFADVG